MDSEISNMRWAAGGMIDSTRDGQVETGGPKWVATPAVSSRLECVRVVRCGAPAPALSLSPVNGWKQVWNRCNLETKSFAPVARAPGDNSLEQSHQYGTMFDDLSQRRDDIEAAQQG
jgi:hypothetical protein